MIYRGLESRRIGSNDCGISYAGSTSTCWASRRLITMSSRPHGSLAPALRTSSKSRLFRRLRRLVRARRGARRDRQPVPGVDRRDHEGQAREVLVVELAADLEVDVVG